MVPSGGVPDDPAGEAEVAGIQQDAAVLIHIVGIGVDVDAEIAAGKALPQLRLEGMDALEDEDGIFVVVHRAGDGGASALGEIEDGEFGVAPAHQGIDRLAEAVEVQPLDGLEVFGAVLPQGHQVAVAVEVIQRDAHRPPAECREVGDEEVGGGGFAGGGGAAEQHDMAAAGGDLFAHLAQPAAEAGFGRFDKDLRVFEYRAGKFAGFAGVAPVGVSHGGSSFRGGIGRGVCRVCAGGEPPRRGGGRRPPGRAKPVTPPGGRCPAGRSAGGRQELRGGPGAGIRPAQRLTNIILHLRQKCSTTISAICGCGGAAARKGKAAGKLAGPQGRHWHRWGWKAGTRR